MVNPQAKKGIVHNWHVPSTDKINTFLSKASAVYDWTRLGIFTGS
jgi:hypothetical protein